jgi:hypothetical protein
MSKLSSHLTKALAAAVVTASALGGNVMAATCAGAKCGPKKMAAKCGACGAKGAACAASGARHKMKAKTKCGACSAKK